MRATIWKWNWLYVGIAVFIVTLGLAVSPVLAIEAPPGVETAAPTAEALRAPMQSAPGNQLQNTTLLEDWFGVTLQLTNTLAGGANPWSFVLSRFAPTKRLETVEWTQEDWYGNWNVSNLNQTTVRGKAASGGEWYDVEALYFDNDEDNIYITVVTSFPFEGQNLSGTPVAGEVGLQDTRAGTPPVWIRPGDLSLNLGLNAQVSGWSYDFGVDLTDEIRPASGNITTMRSNTLGDHLYRTQNGAWYVGHPSNSPPAQGELTNFDPVTSAGLVTDRGVMTVAYYPLSFSNQGVTIKENGADTWVIEVTIPRSALAHEGRPDGPTDGDTIKIRWASSCRNDASGTNGVISLTGVVQLGLKKSVSPAAFEVETGSTIPLTATYTFVVYNPKNSNLTNVTLVDNFTAFSFGNPVEYCLTAKSITSTRSISIASMIPLQANLGTLAPGDIVTVTLVTHVQNCGIGTWPNTAVADADETDPISDDASFIIEAQPSAVALARFEAFPQEQGILVEWETATELDNLGFHLYRAEAAAGPWELLNATLIPVANPGAVFGSVYTWHDADVEPGATYFYRLEDVDIEGLSTFHGPVQVTASLGGPAAVNLTSFSAGGGGGLWLPLALSALALLGGVKRRK